MKTHPHIISRAGVLAASCRSLKYPSSLKCMAGLILLLGGLRPSLAHTETFTIVSPNGLEEREGNGVTGSAAPAFVRYQSVRLADDFSALPPGPHPIIGMNLRLDGGRPPQTAETSDVQVRLSTTTAAPGDLSRVFSENAGPDELLVRTGPMTFSSAAAGPVGGPTPFDYKAEFDDPFYYDPGVGNLLVDWTILGLSASPYLDSHAVDSTTTHQILGFGGTVATLDQGSAVVMEVVFDTASFPEELMAGDADQNLRFDQLDLVRVQQAAKYLSGQTATWGEGDWDGAPGGAPGNPPSGDGFFNQLDVIAALAPSHYLTGPYGALTGIGQIDNAQTSIVYNAGIGELAIDAPAGVELTSVNIDSAAGIFTGSSAENLGGSFDNDADNNIFKATFGSSFGSLTFGNVAQAGLSREFVLGDLSVIGSLAGGGDLGDVDLVYVPEPTSALLLAFGLVIGLFARLGKS